MGVLLYRNAPQIEQRPLELPFAGWVLGNCKVTQVLWLQEGNINDSHFCFVTIQLTKSKQLVQLSPMSCFHQSAVIENC